MATPITSVTGIGATTATALAEYGFRSAEDLAQANEVALAAVPGFGIRRAAATIQTARKLLESAAERKAAAPEASVGGTTYGTAATKLVKKITPRRPEDDTPASEPAAEPMPAEAAKPERGSAGKEGKEKREKKSKEAKAAKKAKELKEAKKAKKEKKSANGGNNVR